jgi:hypothetical protein
MVWDGRGVGERIEGSGRKEREEARRGNMQGKQRKMEHV